MAAIENAYNYETRRDRSGVREEKCDDAYTSVGSLAQRQEYDDTTLGKH